MKSEIKRFIEKNVVEIINKHKDKFPIVGAQLAGEKILIPLKEDLNEDQQNEISNEISLLITLELENLRTEGKIANLPILTFITNPKLITIEI